jgi:hypothetical protein
VERWFGLWRDLLDQVSANPDARLDLDRTLPDNSPDAVLHRVRETISQ